MSTTWTDRQTCMLQLIPPRAALATKCMPVKNRTLVIQRVLLGY